MARALAKGKATGAKAPASARGKGKADSTEKRGKNGQFLPGNAGGGRPPLPPELKEAAKAASPEALEILIGIMKDTAARAGDRIRAAEIVMNRAYGTPPASVEVTNLSDLPSIIIEARE